MSSNNFKPIQPLHSVIIPTYNRSNNLSAALTSVCALNGISEIEIIVVDNGSTDNTKKICDSFNSLIPKLTYVYDDMPGLLTGRHKGASLAKANIISFIDDDVELNPDWSVGIQKAFEEDEEVHLLTGPCLPKYETTPPQWLRYFWNTYPEGNDCPWLSLADRGDKIKEIDSLYVWGLNFSIRKRTFYNLDGFHPDNVPIEFQQFQGDGETGLARKAKENNYKALYLPNAMLHHFISKERLTIAYFEKRFYYQGVCDSFTQLRMDYGLYKQESKGPGTENILIRFA